MRKKKLYLVKRGVYATSMKDAVTRHGEVLEIVLAEASYQQEYSSNNIGFKKSNNKKKDEK